MKHRKLTKMVREAGLTIEPVQVGPEFCEVDMLYPLFGIRRTMTYRGLKEGWFKSVLIRQPGNKSGKRLIYVESVRQWLLSKMAKQSMGEAKKIGPFDTSTTRA